MLYELVVSLIGELPIEFEFVYGMVTIVASIFGILLLFTPIIICLKVFKS